MKNFVIVPSHNQGRYIHSIISAYDKQTVPPDAVVFVLDRCFDNSIDLIKQFFPKNIKVFYTTTNDSVGFSAGKTRDIGIDFVTRNFPEYESILFTDGDCVPNEKVVELHLDCFSKTDKAAVSCGRRVMLTENGEIEEDERISGRWINGYSFTTTNARLIVSKRTALDSIFTYSCNLAFNRKAIELCKHINSTISNSNRVFNPEFDGSWGGEDNFISDCLFRTGNDILLTSLEGYVTHQYHTPAPRENLFLKMKILKNLSNRLKTHIMGLNIDGPITEFEKKRNIDLIDEDLSNIFTTVSISSETEVLTNKILTPELSEYTCVIQAIFSRNIDMLPAIETRGKPNRIPELILDQIKDMSAFLKVYRNGQDLIIGDMEEYKFLNLRVQFSSLCKTCG